MEENGDKSLKKSKGPEHLLTFIKVIAYESEYLTHRVLLDTGAVLASY